MDKFINRYDELKTLEKEFSNAGSSFVVLYGRRRVGKTSLIAEFLRRHKDSLYFLATEESEPQNLKAFKEQAAVFLGNELLKTADADWQLVFKMLSEKQSKTKKIIVIDEFQYIGQSNSAFPSVMQRIWDTLLKDAGVMLILCGSLVSLMKSQVLDYSSPLYGRRTAQIKLKQIEFEHYGEFFAGYTNDELLPYYAVTGGVPKYIEVFKEYGDIYQAIKENILSKNSFLYEEPYFLLQKEVSEIGSYFSLIKSIAAGNRKLEKISADLGIKSTSLTKYLKVLTDLDLIEREIPVTETYPEKSKSGLYRITDNYIAFWFKFVYPYRANLEKGEVGYVLEQIKKGFIQNYASYVYEAVCRERMWGLSAQGKFKFRFNKVGSYWGQKIGETDIVALDTVDKNLIVGECKYTVSPKGLEVFHDLEKKAAALKELTGGNAVQYVIFSTAGFTQGLTEKAERNSDIVLIDKPRI